MNAAPFWWTKFWVTYLLIWYCGSENSEKLSCRRCSPLRNCEPSFCWGYSQCTCILLFFGRYGYLNPILSTIYFTHNWHMTMSLYIPTKEMRLNSVIGHLNWARLRMRRMIGKCSSLTTCSDEPRDPRRPLQTRWLRNWHPAPSWHWEPDMTPTIQRGRTVSIPLHEPDLKQVQ